MGKFPARMFRWAAIYGVIVLAPLYLLPLPPVGPEAFLGFVGLALVFQGVFWTIGSDPVKYRPIMPYAIAEKLVFGLPTLALWSRGMVQPPVSVFAAIDVALAVGFTIAWHKTPSAAS